MLSFSQREILKNSPLFQGVRPEEIGKFLEKAGALPRSFEAGAVIVEQGGRQSEICIVLSGLVRGEKLTADGRSIIVNEFAAGELFGEMLSGGSEKSPVRVLMSEPGEIISIPFSALVREVEGGFQARERILRNLINEISGKYFTLMKQLNMLLCPTLRGKIANYLLIESKNGGKLLGVPHTREEQAKLMNCDRSALSRELSKMKREGIINFAGKHFEILDMERLKNISQ